jgi:hypothetical protein
LQEEWSEKEEALKKSVQANLSKVEELEKEVSKSPPTIAEIPAMSEEDYIASLKDEVDSQRKEIEQLKK